VYTREGILNLPCPPSAPPARVNDIKISCSRQVVVTFACEARANRVRSACEPRANRVRSACDDRGNRVEIFYERCLARVSYILFLVGLSVGTPFLTVYGLEPSAVPVMVLRISGLVPFSLVVSSGVLPSCFCTPRVRLLCILGSGVGCCRRKLGFPISLEPALILPRGSANNKGKDTTVGCRKHNN
jgi:hypothetical protein